MSSSRKNFLQRNQQLVFKSNYLDGDAFLLLSFRKMGSYYSSQILLMLHLFIRRMLIAIFDFEMRLRKFLSIVAKFQVFGIGMR